MSSHKHIIIGSSIILCSIVVLVLMASLFTVTITKEFKPQYPDVPHYNYMSSGGLSIVDINGEGIQREILRNLIEIRLHLQNKGGYGND